MFELAPSSNCTTGKEEFYILMTNVFGGDIEVDEQYDLKGTLSFLF